MEFEVSSNFLNKISADLLVVFVFEGKKTFEPTADFLRLDKSLNGLLSSFAKLERFYGKNSSLLSVFTQGKILALKVVVVGLGKKEEYNLQELRKALAKVSKNFAGKIKSLAVSLPKEGNFDVAKVSQVTAEGLLLGSYKFNKYKKKEEDEKELGTIILSCEKVLNKKVEAGIENAKLYYQATKLARDLVNDQSAVVTPIFLAKVAQDVAKGKKNITCKIYDKAQLEKMEMQAFLGVARASVQEPKFIHLEYNPSSTSGSNTKKVAIVGKGITFDTGGVNVKTDSGMQTMKIDMSGAAAVLGLFSVIDKIKPKFSVMGLIAATPNLISGTSLVPGDVLKAMNGKTIEVLNTDAEGRVTLADSFSFAVVRGATEIIDLATLTGACMVALGTDIAGLFSNNKDLAKKLKEAADEAGESVWELPLTKDYKELNKSEVADVANIPSTRWGGAITAALFLEEFVDNKPWVHLDIAGPAFAEKDFNLGPKGGTGFGVRTLLGLLEK